jgi:hydrogenase maturation protein HypF
MMILPPRMRLTVHGIVQGVGFRPYVYRLAQDCDLGGFVRNTAQGVVIEIQGKRCNEFLRRLPMEAPPLVLITDLLSETLPSAETEGFRIVESEGGSSTSALIPADVALCDDCLHELLDPDDRRYQYPFINCTNCGPRYTITAAVPYDRPQTSMRDFPMCARCDQEYNDPADRRFHAQPNACADCGPHLRYTEPGGPDFDPGTDRIGSTALNAAMDLLQQGGILALRGLGGYHLAVNAFDDRAVQMLRHRKRRYEKPLAVMLPDLAAVREHCVFNDVEASALSSAQKPIVILERHLDSSIAASVSLDNPTLGVMLPYTPLHVLLAQRFPALVMSSANVSEEPICIAEMEAEQRLADIADGFLHHNRDILQRCDDSVQRVIADEIRPVRRARGYVPRPVLLAEGGDTILATGAELKNTFCLAKGKSAIISQHIGDFENLETMRFFEEALSHLLSVFDVSPAAIAHDMHPGYLATQWALHPAGQALRKRFEGLPRIPVQHHHAHFASCLAENAQSGPAIGIILDGTGYGLDASSWGGEFLVGTMLSVQRAAHFHALPMPGADKAIREPWRMAWAALLEAGLHPVHDVPDFAARRSAAEQEAISFALTANVNTPASSGCGRLFDAVAALIGLADTVSFEAQAAMALEFAAGGRLGSPYSVNIDVDVAKGMPIELSFLPMFEEIVQDMRNGVGTDKISRRFHATLTEACAAMTLQLADTFGIRTVLLSGGVFQNALLFQALLERLTSSSLTVLTHRQVPANDAGISLGQAAVARAIMKG